MSAAPTEESTPEPTTFDLAGAVVLKSAGVADVDYVVCVFKADGLDEDAACRTKVGEKCSGDTSNLEMAKGAEVLVKDAEGAIVGVGALKHGVISKATSPRTDGYFVCSFRFAVPDVTDTGDFYQVEVAGRQPKTFRKADASALLVVFNEA